MKPTNLKLHIDNLVLDGLPKMDRHELHEVITQELERQFLHHGIPRSVAQNRLVVRLSNHPITVTAQSDARAVGTQVARSVYIGLQE